jgi:hypothetical protein
MLFGEGIRLRSLRSGNLLQKNWQDEKKEKPEGQHLRQGLSGVPNRRFSAGLSEPVKRR